MSLTVILTIFTSFLASAVQCSPTITTQKTSPIQKSVGDTVWMLCQIKDLNNEVVLWKFVDHSKFIARGDKLQVSDVNHYKIEVLQGETSDAPASYILHIFNIQTDDQGYYECSVDKTNQTLTYQLQIIEAPTLPPPPAVHSYNFTDCCVREGVSSACQPVCDPFQQELPANFDPLIACALDLPKLLKCGSDGKNHAPCCKRRSLPDICQDFCLGKVPSNLEDTHLECMNKTLDIIKCYEEGQNVLPLPPTSISTVANANGFVVNWQPPTKNQKLIKGFYIHYRLSADTTYKTSQKINRDLTSSLIGGLLSNKIYVIYMSSFSDYGSSQPSEFITQATLGGQAPIEQNYNIQVCCDKAKIPMMCKQSLCKSNVFEDLDPSVILSCYGYLDEMMKCVTGERNHTGCCQRNGISDECLGFCSGNMPSLDNNLSQCMIKLPLIEACVREGLATIPGPPENIKLTEVTTTTATLSWDPPSTGANVTQYIVSYLEHSLRDRVSTPNKNTTDSTTIQLTGLTPNTEYDLTVISANDAGQSLMSPDIAFLTFDISPSEPPITPSPGPVLPYNLTECCMEKSLSQKCLKLCDYDFIISASTTELYTIALECSNDFDTVILCGADGRDHTQCCRERQIPENCLNVCKGDMNNADILCAFQAPKITQCFVEGIVDQPRPPSSVSIAQITSHTVTVSWSPPTGGPKAESYYVYYNNPVKKEPQDNKIMTNKTTYILQSLESGYTYDIYIVSANSEGFSIPSPSLSAFIPPDDHSFNCSDDFAKYSNNSIDLKSVLSVKKYTQTTVGICKQKCLAANYGDQCTGFRFNTSTCLLVIGKHGNIRQEDGADFYARNCDFKTLIQIPKPNISTEQYWTNQQECCTNHNISDNCMSYCQTGNAFSSPDKCGNEFPTVVACASDGKNHSSCCQQAGVPRSCLPYCWGAVMDKDHPVAQLCLSYTRMFVTCFTKGARTIPSMVTGFSAIDIQATHVVLSWMKPDQNCNESDCRYDVQWLSKGESNTIYALETTTANITNLQPETDYHITVSATNQYGSSLPSPLLNVRTRPINKFEVNFYIRPRKVIDSGLPVRLICEVFGAPEATVSISFKTKVKTTNREFAIDSVSKDDAGEYTCTVKQAPNVVDTVVKTLNLMVRYKPEILQVFSDHVEPDAAKTAYLKCIFNGLPLQVTWKRNEKPVPARYPTTTHVVFNADGTMSDTLLIHNIRSEMFGRYECNGTNKFGYAVGQLSLKSDYIPPTEAPLPTPVAGNVTDCCRRGGVRGVCMELCDLTLDFAVITEDKYDDCLQLLPVFASCAGDEKDHSFCCDQRGVKPYCKPFCKGSTPDLSDTLSLLTCVEEATDIVECIEQGRILIPYAPQNVRAVQQSDRIHVHWDAPKYGTAKVTKYDIYYKTSRDLTVQHITVDKTIKNINSIKIPQKSNGVSYYIWVTAGNSHGNSLQAGPRAPLNVSDFPPLAPKDLQAGAITGNTIDLTWTAPEYIANIADYVVFYKIRIENGIPKELTVPVPSTKTTLISLSLSTEYEIYVAGRTKLSVTGDKSNVITVKTGSKIHVTDESNGKQDSGSSSGVVAAVIIIILVLVGAAVAGVLYYRRRNRHRFSEAVTFENPQYGTAHDSQIKISGLPTDSTEDNPFGYSPLQEEREFNSPMLDVDHVEFKPRK
ncbi:Ig-like and fibronectin type-III domain-containing protein 2 [Mytilus californianus]|uniref:Ig-like and fibronectin type-III domain-containing protein 2 n=1 Tax=Mytilus californianus TaxID=6549 RepID=UPI0022464A2C|nr:Ig-like and fibronectin type-III domain-containing protein 2 [Mytilus californianus]